MARQGRAGSGIGDCGAGFPFCGHGQHAHAGDVAPPLAEIAFPIRSGGNIFTDGSGLIAAIVLARGSLVKAIAMIILGDCCSALSGADTNTGLFRFTFGLPQLADGIGFVVVAMGLFGFSEIIAIWNGAPIAKS